MKLTPKNHVYIADKLYVNVELVKEIVEGKMTKNTDGKTYYDGHPDVIRDQALTDILHALEELDNI